MKTAEEKAFDDKIEQVELEELMYDEFYELIAEAIKIGKANGHEEAMRWRDPKEGLPNRDIQVVIKGGILKNEVGPDIENDYSAGYYDDGVWYVSPTDYYSIEIENPTGWRPIE